MALSPQARRMLQRMVALELVLLGVIGVLIVRAPSTERRAYLLAGLCALLVAMIATPSFLYFANQHRGGPTLPMGKQDAVGSESSEPS